MLHHDFRIIDAHTHVTSTWEELGLITSLERSIELMDRFGIDLACTFHSRSLRTDCRVENTRLAAAVAQFPDRLIGYVTINPWFTEEAVHEVQRGIEELGFSGIKLHEAHLLITYNYPLFEPVYQTIAKYDVPILFHTWNNPEPLKAVAMNHPELTLIAGHSGGHGWHGFVPALVPYKNVYFEICCSCCEIGIVEYIVELAGAERVLFGTDLPLIDPAIAYFKVMRADLSDEQKRLIMGENIARILKLEDE